MIFSSDVAYDSLILNGAPKLSPATVTTPVLSNIYKDKSDEVFMIDPFEDLLFK